MIMMPVGDQDEVGLDIIDRPRKPRVVSEERVDHEVRAVGRLDGEGRMAVEGQFGHGAVDRGWSESDRAGGWASTAAPPSGQVVRVALTDQAGESQEEAVERQTSWDVDSWDLASLWSVHSVDHPTVHANRPLEDLQGNSRH